MKKAGIKIHVWMAKFLSEQLKLKRIDEMQKKESKFQSFISTKIIASCTKKA